MAKKLFKKGQQLREIGLWEKDDKGNIILYFHDIIVNSCGDKIMIANGNRHPIENLKKLKLWRLSKSIMKQKHANIYT